MKNIFKLTLLLMPVLLCFVGCASNAQTSEKDIFIIGSVPNSSSSSSSDSESLMEVSSNDEISNSASDSGINESTTETSSDDEVSYAPISIDDINYDQFDFTEDDLWLQSFIRENWSMAYLLYRTYANALYEFNYEQLNIDDEHKLRYYLQCPNFDLPYELIPNVYFNNAEEYQALCDKYFYSVKASIPRADIIDPEKDYISIPDWTEPYNPSLIEINGRLYHYPSTMGGAFLPCQDMEKVISKTDDEIVFSYLCYINNLGDVEAGKGVLKKENGEWKFGWFYLYQPIELLDIHEVWGL